METVDCKDLEGYYNPPLSARGINDTNTDRGKKSINPQQEIFTYDKIQNDSLFFW